MISSFLSEMVSRFLSNISSYIFNTSNPTLLSKINSSAALKCPIPCIGFFPFFTRSSITYFISSSEILFNWLNRSSTNAVKNAIPPVCFRTYSVVSNAIFFFTTSPLLHCSNMSLFSTSKSGNLINLPIRNEEPALLFIKKDTGKLPINTKER